VAISIPAVLVGGLAAKNLVMFGSPGTSSWLGMSLAKMTVAQLPRAELERLRGAGVVDAVAFVPPFAPWAHYQAAGVPPPEPTGVAVRDVPGKRTGPLPINFNYDGFLEVDDRALENDLEVIERYPEVYAEVVAEGWQIYLGSPTQYRYLSPDNRSAVRPVEELWRVVGYGESPTSRDSPWIGGWRLDNVGWLVAASMLLVVVALAAAVTGRPRRVAAVVRARPGALVGLSFVLFLPLVANALEIDENNRFRYEVEPLQIVLTVWLVAALAGLARPPVSTTPAGGSVGGSAVVPPGADPAR
jgi:hypothetical protein